MSTLRDILTAVRSDVTTAVNGQVPAEDVRYLNGELPASTNELPVVVYEVFTNRRPIGQLAPAPEAVYDSNGDASDERYTEYVTATFDVRALAEDMDALLTIHELIRQQFLPYDDGRDPTAGPYSSDVGFVGIDDSSPADSDAIRGMLTSITVHFKRRSTESVTPIDKIRVDQDNDGTTEYTITDST